MYPPENYPVISSDALMELLFSQTNHDDGGLAVFDATWFLPAENRDAEAEFRHAHIPGALRFDIDVLSDHRNPLPHMLPGAEEFSAAMQKLGIHPHTRIVVYDGKGLFSAARAWWMFRYFGHDRVWVLDGGLPAWKKAGGEMESSPARETGIGSFSAVPRLDWVVTSDDILQNLEERGREAESAQGHLILDARSAGRFSGKEPEPRPGMRSGHIPGSRNIPFTALLKPETSELLPPDRLQMIFRESGVDQSPVVVTCGSGVTACVLVLGLKAAGFPPPQLYDGSWSEWGSRENLPLDS